MTNPKERHERAPEDNKALAIRPMTTLDLDQVIEIERQSFREPWTKTNFECEMLSQDLSESNVAVLGDRVLGYTVVWHQDEEVHLANIAVCEEYRERGIGKALVEYVLVRAKEQGARTIMLEVRESNLEARRLYETLGFRAVGLKRNYYKKEKEDAVLMRCLFERDPDDQGGHGRSGG